MSIFIVSLPSSHYGMNWYIAVQLQTGASLEFAQKMAGDKWATPEKEKGNYHELSGAELKFDMRGLSQILTVAW